MSLLLNGSKTLTIAGTEMSCLEIYTGEAYTFPLAFTDNTGNAANCNGWTLSTSAKFYNADTLSYTDANVIIGNLTLNSPQPSTGAGTYSANLSAKFTNANLGVGYLYVPADLTGGTGTPNPTPTITLANNTSNSTIVVVTLEVSRASQSNVSLTDINKEPLGFIVRYQ